MHIDTFDMQHMCLPACTSTPLTCNAKAGASAPTKQHHTSTPPPTASGNHISPNSHHPNTSPNLNHTSKPSSLRQARTPPPTRIIHTPQPTSYTSHDPTRIIYIPRPNPILQAPPDPIMMLQTHAHLNTVCWREMQVVNK